MQKNSFLSYFSLLLFFEGYLLSNIVPILFGIFILLFLIALKLSFNPKFETEVFFDNLEVTENETIKIKVNIDLKNYSNLNYIFKIIPENENFNFEIVNNGLNGDLYSIDIFLKPKLRGSFLIKNLKLKVLDNFQIFEKEFEILINKEITVYPSNESIFKGIKADKNIKLSKDALSSKFGIKTSEFDHLRDYTLGDQFKQINWKASLKMGRLISKEFLNEIDGEITILLDVSKNFLKDFKGGTLKTDYISILTFQIAYFIIKNNKPVNIIFFDDSGPLMVKNNVKTKDELKKCLSGILIPSKGSPYIQLAADKNNIKNSFLNILKPFLKESPEKFLSVLKLVCQNSSVILITDTKRTYEIINLQKELMKKKSNLFLVSPNPYLFGYNLDFEKIYETYKNYTLREKNILKLNKICPAIDVGPKDLADEILEEFK